MRRMVKHIVLWSAFALMPTAIQGQWIDDYQGILNHGDEYYLNYEGVGNALVSTSQVSSPRVYVGPYVGSFSGVTAPSFSIMCVDFQATAGSQNVVVSSLAAGMDDPDMAATRFAQSQGTTAGSMATYRQAAYLASLIDSWEDYGTSRQSVWTNLHANIWNIMSGTSYSVSDYGGALWAGMDSFDADGWYVLTGTGDNPGQEMLVRGPTATVPEPSTYLLMATGLFFLVFLGRRRKELDGVS